MKKPQRCRSWDKYLYFTTPHPYWVNIFRRPAVPAWSSVQMAFVRFSIRRCSVFAATMVSRHNQTSTLLCLSEGEQLAELSWAAIYIHHSSQSESGCARQITEYGAAQEERFPSIGPRVRGVRNPDRLHAGTVFRGRPTLLDAFSFKSQSSSNIMASTKSSSLTPPLRGLASWLFGAFLLAAIDHAEGQTPMVSWSELTRARR